MEIIAFRDKGWFDEATDKGMWHHLCHAYGVSYQLVRDFPLMPGKTIVLFDENADVLLDDFEHIDNAVYVFGRSGMDHMPLLIEHDLRVRIDVPTPGGTMFGHHAAAIVLADRERKRGRLDNR